MKSLGALEAQLDPSTFFRANRSQIINLQWVGNVESEVDTSLAVTLRDGPKVAISRRRSRMLRDSLSF